MPEEATRYEAAAAEVTETAPNPATDARVRYAAAAILDRPLHDFQWPSWLVYGPPGPSRQGIRIVPSGFFGHDYGTSRTLPQLPLQTIEDVPLLFGTSSIERQGAELVVHADILASAFFLLTRYEEWVRKDVRDEHGRFPGKESLACRAGFIERPLVDEYSELLRGWAADAGVPLPPWDRNFRVLLTHDIDTLGPELGAGSTLRKLGAGLLRRKRWKVAFEEAAAACGIARHRFNNLEEVQQLDGALSRRLNPDVCGVIYFFMAGATSPRDQPYELRSPLARKAIRQVLASGAEVGLHASYSAGEDPDRIAEERAQLEAIAQTPVTKNRHHFLNWREMWHGRSLAAGGIRWDSTLGFADLPGFRLGVCRPVPLFDPVACTPLGIDEHPLTVMDCSLSFPKYMGLDEEEAFGCVRRLVDATRRHQGEFILNWHNTSLSALELGYSRSLYVRILNYLATIAAS
jgi:hypothetical protein